MGYDPKIYEQVRKEFAEARQAREDEAKARQAEVEERVPGVREVSRRLASAGIRIWEESRKGGTPEEMRARLDALKEENLALQGEKAKLLEAAGYPAEYPKLRFACPRCQDTGFYGPPFQQQMCDCMKEALCRASVRATGIGALIDTQTFDNFNTGYYTDVGRAKRNLARCRSFAANPAGNLLLLGATGLGKTHLSSAIAGVAIAAPYYVVYETAGALFAAFHHEQFGRRSYDDDREDRTAKYFECELLILDDLGAEMITNHTISALYLLLNDRINRRAPMVVSTNLSPGELTERYTDRIASRLLGEFDPVIFEGNDIRQLKKRGKTS